MPSMKVTVSAAMRARDVSRPQPHHEAAAEEDVAAARPASPQRARTPRHRFVAPGLPGSPCPPGRPHRPSPGTGPHHRETVPRARRPPEPGDSHRRGTGHRRGQAGPAAASSGTAPARTPEPASGDRPGERRGTWHRGLRPAQPSRPRAAQPPGEPHEPAGRASRTKPAGRASRAEPAGPSSPLSRPGGRPRAAQAAHGAPGRRPQRVQPQAKRKRVRRRRSHGR